MKASKKISKLLSIFFLGMYLFAAFFAAGFHHHGNTEESSSTKSSDIYGYSEAGNHTETAGCYSCHLLHHNITTVPQEFCFHVAQPLFFTEEHYAFEQYFSNPERHTPPLRGPPSSFI
ncbi:hypothetical protein [Chryseobacterium lacus]|uniref:hypothetical protein n=1 Tax=Chryseobacterium lacus TaxID=2058346 RepID=UPI000F8970F6|nr:hypothetical protein [Chryseobacterium lacus]RST26029.1 hypothetical protein EIZ46_07625 [Chryseobacterium lacus]